LSIPAFFQKTPVSKRLLRFSGKSYWLPRPLPLDDLRRQSPQLLCQPEISNKTGQGTEALQQTLAQATAQLPLMREILIITDEN